MNKILVIIILLLSTTSFAQTQIGVIDCTQSSTNCVSGAQYDITTAQYNSHDSFTISRRSDGHGTFMYTGEVGINGTSENYAMTVIFPYVINIAEIHGNVDFVSWCNGSDGFLLNIKGSVFPLPGVTENLGSFKATLSGILPSPDPNNLAAATKFFSYSYSFQKSIPMNNFALYHFTDICSVSTFNYTISGTF